MLTVPQALHYSLSSRVAQENSTCMLATLRTKSSWRLGPRLSSIKQSSVTLRRCHQTEESEGFGKGIEVKTSSPTGCGNLRNRKLMYSVWKSECLSTCCEAGRDSKSLNTNANLLCRLFICCVLLFLQSPYPSKD